MFHKKHQANCLLQLLLGAQVVGVSTLLLAAVDSTRMEASVALAADHFVTVVLLGQLSQRWLDNASTKTQHKMKGGLFLDVIVWQGATILKLFASEDQTLLIRRNAFLILDLGLDIFNSIAGLNLKGDCFPRQRLHEYLHLGRPADSWASTKRGCTRRKLYYIISLSASHQFFFMHKSVSSNLTLLTVAKCGHN